MIDLLRSEGAAGGLRAGLLLLVVLGVVGTALALAFDRHWQSPLQMPPWIVLGIISVAWIALVVRQTRATVWLARGARRNSDRARRPRARPHDDRAWWGREVGGLGGAAWGHG